MTLVEILVAMTLASVITAAVAMLFQVHHRMAMKQEETTLMQQELLAATSQMAEELRMCGYSPTNAPGFGFMHKPNTASLTTGEGPMRRACTAHLIRRVTGK
jgi:Tfp pilus assembly protein PilW